MEAFLLILPLLDAERFWLDEAEQDISAAEEMERSRSDSVGSCCGLMPNNLRARTELSKIYQQQKKWKEAEAILLHVLQLNPMISIRETELSKLYQNQDRMPEAGKNSARMSR